MTDETVEVSFRQVLRNKDFLRLWLAGFISTFGDWLATVALISLLAFRLKGTPSQVSLVLMSYIVPFVIVGPLLGVFADRWDVKKAMVLSDIIRAVLAVLLLFSTQPYHFYLIILALSSVSCLFMPCQNIAVQNLVRKEELLVANSLNLQTEQFTKIIGPAFAGALIEILGERICFIIDGFTFAVSALLIATISPIRDHSKDKPSRSTFAELRDTVSFIWSHRAIRFMILSTAVAVIALGGYSSTVAVYVRDVLSSSAVVYGGMVSSVGVGTVIGALLVAKAGQNRSKMRLMALGFLTIGVSILVLAALRNAPVAITASVFVGFGLAFVMIPSETLIQEETPMTTLGKVGNVALALTTGAQLLGLLVGGTVANNAGTIVVYYFISGMLMITALVGARHDRRFHHAGLRGVEKTGADINL
jgi:MFS family permease